MKVKHKNSEKHRSDPSISLEHWQKDYYPNEKYLNIYISYCSRILYKSHTRVEEIKHYFESFDFQSGYILILCDFL